MSELDAPTAVSALPANATDEALGMEELEVTQLGSADSANEDVATELRGLFGRGSLYMVVWALQLISATISTPLLTRVLGETGFGRIALSVTVVQVFVPIASIALQSGLQRIFVQEDGRRRAQGLLFVSLLYSFGITALLAATAFLWGSALGFNGTGNLLYLVVLWAGFSAVTLNGLALLRSEDRFWAFFCVSLVQSVLSYAAGIVASLALGASAVHYLDGMLGTQIVAAVLCICYTRPRVSGLRDGATQKFALRYCLPLIPNALAAFVLNAGDRIVVQHDLGAEAVARYQVAYNIGSLAIILLGTVNQAWAPMFFRIRDDAIRWKVLAALRDEVFRLLSWTVFGLAVGAPVALRLLAPPSYHPNGLLVIVTVVAGSALPFAIYIANVRILLWHKQTGPLAIASGLAALANVGLNIALVPSIHILGSAVATLICYIFLGFFTALVARRIVTLDRPSISVLWEVMIGCALAGLSLLLPTDALWLVVRLLLSGGCLIRLVLLSRSLVRAST
jgi:O-antigen/teichoic acid export membrane protein